MLAAFANIMACISMDNAEANHQPTCHNCFCCTHAHKLSNRRTNVTMHARSIEMLTPVGSALRARYRLLMYPMTPLVIVKPRLALQC